MHELLNNAIRDKTNFGVIDGYFRCSNAKGAHDLASELARLLSHLISVSTESTLPSSINEILSIGLGADADASGGISLSAAAE